MEVKGVEEVIHELRNLRIGVKAKTEKQLSRLGRATVAGQRFIETSLRQRLSFPFRSVPSYLRWKGNRYPPGTKAFFARTSRVLPADWKRQAQLSRDPITLRATAHRLRGELQVLTILDQNGDVTVEIGYPDPPPPHAVHVIFGTSRMQPRPFLDLFLQDLARSDRSTSLRAQFIKAIRQALKI